MNQSPPPPHLDKALADNDPINFALFITMVDLLRATRVNNQMAALVNCLIW